MKTNLKFWLGALLTIALTITVLSPIAETEAQADISSPSDCSRAKGWWTFEYTGLGYWWYAEAETSWIYLNPQGTEPRSPMVQACIRSGYKPKLIVGMYEANAVAAGQDAARYWAREIRAFIRRGSYCHLSTSPCVSWRSWHKEKWANVPNNPYAYYNFNA